MQLNVEFEWDADKARVNLRKHKVPFLRACKTFEDPARIELPDFTSEGSEERWILLGRVGHTILSVVFTMRGEVVRLISARRANRDEQRT